MPYNHFQNAKKILAALKYVASMSSFKTRKKLVDVIVNDLMLAVVSLFLFLTL